MKRVTTTNNTLLAAIVAIAGVCSAPSALVDPGHLSTVLDRTGSMGVGNDEASKFDIALASAGIGESALLFGPLWKT